MSPVFSANSRLRSCRRPITRAAVHFHVHKKAELLDAVLSPHPDARVTGWVERSTTTTTTTTTTLLVGGEPSAPSSRVGSSAPWSAARPTSRRTRRTPPPGPPSCG
jgi:hypothetical protein